MGIDRKNMWIIRHIVLFYCYKFWNMGIHRKYVYCYSHSSLKKVKTN